jgi:triacylglycerol esterase/lipase EstA (alpha/beta hydrolase family)
MNMRFRRLKSWAVIAAAIPTALGLSAVAAPAAHAETSPDGANDWNCKPSFLHPRPVVLVHGTFENMAFNWQKLSPALKKAGYCVYALNYGGAKDAPIQGTGEIAASAGQLSAFVDKVLAATGASKVDMVGHSQGGMMPRYYLKFLGGADKVNALVGIAPDNHGTDLDGLTNLLPYFPGAADLLKATTPGLADQMAGSAFLTKLNAGGDTVPGVHYTVIATKYDEVATPWRSQYLTGSDVRNVLLQDLCPLDLSEHVAIGLFDRIAFHEVANALDPAHASATTCASALS